jgi:hypothetical protein
MKIAVCFYGQLRTAEFAYLNLKRYFGDLFQSIDFFIHTWNIDFVPRPYQVLKTVYKEPVQISDEAINKYKTLYNPVNFLVDDQITLREQLVFPNGRESDDYHFVSEMYFPYLSFYKSIQLKQEYEKLNNFKYDVVIKLRPDIIFPPDRHFQSDLNDFFLDPGKIHICYHDDVFHIGTSENMDIAASCITSEKNEIREASNLPFIIFEEHLLKHSIPITKLGDCRFTVLRNELQNLDTTVQYHEVCYLNSVLYSEIFYHLKYSWKWWYNPTNPKWKEDMYEAFEKFLHAEDLKLMIEQHLIDV